MAETLDIKDELNAIDYKDYDFYKNLTPGQQKIFSPFVLMRFVSNAQGDQDIQEWFVEMTNELVNKYHWDLSKNHKELLSKLFAAVGAGVKVRHQYLAAGKKEKMVKVAKLLAEIHPTMKLDEVKILASMMTPADITELCNDLGMDKAQHKAYK